ncbi:hypothetical protein V8B97DRAFT_1914027 [Scleroderma yunnanense]
MAEIPIFHLLCNSPKLTCIIPTEDLQPRNLGSEPRVLSQEELLTIELTISAWSTIRHLKTQCFKALTLLATGVPSCKPLCEEYRMVRYQAHPPNCSNELTQSPVRTQQGADDFTLA